MSDIRLMIVDDQELMRDGLAAILKRQAGIEVVGTASDGQDALNQLDTLKPDVILMDVRMPTMNGIDATRQAKRDMPEIQVLMLTTFDDDDYIADALSAGAVGYILKNVPAEDLADAIKLAAKGIMQLDATVAPKVVASLSAARNDDTIAPPHISPDSPFATLTPRELEVVALVAQGANNREIADALVISEGTVKSHISSILSQLNLRDRTQLAVFYLQHQNTTEAE